MSRSCFALAGLLLALGCARQAPEPEECLTFASRWYRGQAEPELRTDQEAFEALTLRCLTEPFDARFVRCGNERGSLRACIAEREVRVR